MDFHYGQPYMVKGSEELQSCDNRAEVEFVTDWSIVMTPMALSQRPAGFCVFADWIKPQTAANELMTNNQRKQMSLPAAVRANSIKKHSAESKSKACFASVLETRKSITVIDRVKVI